MKKRLTLGFLLFGFFSLSVSTVFARCDGWADPGSEHRNAGNGCFYTCSGESWSGPNRCDGQGNGQFQGNAARNEEERRNQLAAVAQFNEQARRKIDEQGAAATAAIAAQTADQRSREATRQQAMVEAQRQEEVRQVQQNGASESQISEITARYQVAAQVVAQAQGTDRGTTIVGSNAQNAQALAQAGYDPTGGLATGNVSVSNGVIAAPESRLAPQSPAAVTSAGNSAVSAAPGCDMGSGTANSQDLGGACCRGGVTECKSGTCGAPRDGMFGTCVAVASPLAPKEIPSEDERALYSVLNQATIECGRYSGSGSQTRYTVNPRCTEAQIAEEELKDYCREHPDKCETVKARYRDYQAGWTNSIASQARLAQALPQEANAFVDQQTAACAQQPAARQQACFAELNKRVQNLYAPYTAASSSYCQTSEEQCARLAKDQAAKAAEVRQAASEASKETQRLARLRDSMPECGASRVSQGTTGSQACRVGDDLTTYGQCVGNLIMDGGRCVSAQLVVNRAFPAQPMYQICRGAGDVSRNAPNSQPCSVQVNDNGTVRYENALRSSCISSHQLVNGSCQPRTQAPQTGTGNQPPATNPPATTPPQAAAQSGENRIVQIWNDTVNTVSQTFAGFLGAAQNYQIRRIGELEDTYTDTLDSLEDWDGTNAHATYTSLVNIHESLERSCNSLRASARPEVCSRLDTLEPPATEAAFQAQYFPKEEDSSADEPLVTTAPTLLLQEPVRLPPVVRQGTTVVLPTIPVTVDQATPVVSSDLNADAAALLTLDFTAPAVSECSPLTRREKYRDSQGVERDRPCTPTAEALARVKVVQACSETNSVHVEILVDSGDNGRTIMRRCDGYTPIAEPLVPSTQTVAPTASIPPAMQPCDPINEHEPFKNAQGGVEWRKCTPTAEAIAGLEILDPCDPGDEIRMVKDTRTGNVGFQRCQ